MGALSRLQAYLQAQYTLPAWTFAKWAQQFPVDLLKIVPGLTVGSTSSLPVPAWNAGTTYNLGDKVSSVFSTWVSLVGSNTNHLPPTSPTYWALSTPDQYPDVSGDTDGEIYVSSTSTPPSTFVWRTGQWYSLASGSGGGSTYILPPAGAALLGGIYLASAPLGDPTMPKTMVLQPAVGPASQYFDAATSRISNVVDPILPQDAATKNYVDSVASGDLHVLSEPDAESRAIYRAITGGTPAFPTTITWYEDVGHTIKVKEITLTYDGNQNITQEVYKFYHAGVVVQTFTDVITLSGPFETSRTRTVT